MRIALAVVLLAIGAQAPAEAKDEIAAAMDDLFSGYPDRHVRAASVLLASPESATPRLLAEYPHRPEYAQARILWVLAQTGEPGRQAILEIGPPAFDHLVSLHRDRDKWPGALTGLRACKSEFLQHALTRLSGKDDGSGYALGEALADLREESFQPTLSHCLAENPSPRAASACASALGKLEGTNAQNALIANLRHANVGVRGTVLRSLVERGPGAVPGLVEALKRAPASEPETRQEIARTLLELGDPGVLALQELGAAAVPSVADVFVKYSRYTFDRTKPLEGVDARVLAVLRPSRAAALAYLHTRAFQGELPERANSLRLIEELGDRSSIETVMLALGDKESYVRDAAVLALGRIGDEREYSTILHVRPGAGTDAAVLATLISFGPKVVPYLEAVVGGLDQATITDIRLRVCAAGALSSLGDAGFAALKRTYPASAFPLVSNFMESGCGSKDIPLAVRRIAAREAFETLVEKCAHGYPNCPRLLYQLADVPESPSDLSPLSSPKADLWVPALLQRLSETCSEPTSMFAPAAAALGVLKVKRAVDPLTTGLLKRPCPGWIHGNVIVQEAAAEALGRIGDPRALPRLIDFAEDTDIDPIARRAAVKALERIGDPAGLRVAREYNAAPLSSFRPTLRRIEWATLNLVLGAFGVYFLKRRGNDGAATFVRVVFLLIALAWGLGLTFVSLPLDRPSVKALGLFFAALVTLAIGMRFRPARIPEDLARPLMHGAMFTIAGAVVAFVLLLSAIAMLFAR